MKIQERPYAMETGWARGIHGDLDGEALYRWAVDLESRLAASKDIASHLREELGNAKAVVEELYRRRDEALRLVEYRMHHAGHDGLVMQFQHEADLLTAILKAARRQGGMMSERIDGGPAFPVQDLSKWQVPGMSLRDYFAAAALQGLIATPKTVCKAEFVDASGYAILAYQAADAMLDARKAKP